MITVASFVYAVSVSMLSLIHIYIKQCVYKFLRIEFLEILNGLPHTDVFLSLIHI